jgi:hypothetical protein
MLLKTMCYYFTVPTIASPRSIATIAHPLLAHLVRLSTLSAAHRTLQSSATAAGRFNPYIQHHQRNSFTVVIVRAGYLVAHGYEH